MHSSSPSSVPESLLLSELLESLLSFAGTGKLGIPFEKSMAIEIEEVIDVWSYGA